MTKTESLLISETVSEAYERMETRLLLNVVISLNKHSMITSSDEWKLKKLSQIARLNNTNKETIKKTMKELSKILGYSLENVIDDVFNDLNPSFSAMENDGVVEKIGFGGDNIEIDLAVKEYYKEVYNSFEKSNLYMLNDAEHVYNKAVNDVLTIGNTIIKENTSEVITGLVSRSQALKTVVKELGDNGIHCYQDKSGRKWSPEGYSNMVIRTSFSNVANNTMLNKIDQYNIDLIETSSHSGARPKCSKDQGRIFDRKNKSTKYPHWNSTSYGEPDGILGINCQHSVYPFVPGASVQRYFPEPKKENEKKYKLLQKQRASERNLRKLKKERILKKEIGDNSNMSILNLKIKAESKELANFCSKNKLPRRKDRERAFI